MSDALRRQVCLANRKLLTSGLVVMHSGNVSGLSPDGQIVYIKPSGVDYEALTPEEIVAVDLKGRPLQPGLKPSVDLPHHLYLYQHLEGVRAVVHTHSNYATAFAACGRSIPPILTAIADEFGGEIPCAPYTDNEGDAIGATIVKHRTRAPAILLEQHGVFAWGSSVNEALKAAIMVEDVAKTVWLALQIGSPLDLEPQEIEKWWGRYHGSYGQPE